jgi:hypothetical protein
LYLLPTSNKQQATSNNLKSMPILLGHASINNDNVFSHSDDSNTDTTIKDTPEQTTDRWGEEADGKS